MINLHRWTVGTRQFEAVIDEDFEPRSSGEVEALDSGDWVAIGIIEYERCSHGALIEVDALWGIVIENNPAEFEEFARVTRLSNGSIRDRKEITNGTM